jgi:hypothetical protein
MRRTLRVIIGAIAVTLAFTAAPAFAGSPHFIKNAFTASLSSDGLSLTVTGKEVGLGDEETVHIEATADVACVNPGSKRPRAGNKQSVGSGGDFDVDQNGQALFSLTMTADFQPSCSPPMTLEWSNIQVCDTGNAVCAWVKLD